MANLSVFENEHNYLWPTKVIEEKGVFYSSPIFPELKKGKPLFGDIFTQIEQTFSRLELCLYMCNLDIKNIKRLKITAKMGEKKTKEEIQEEIEKALNKFFIEVPKKPRIKINWVSEMYYATSIQAEFVAK